MLEEFPRHNFLIVGPLLNSTGHSQQKLSVYTDLATCEFSTMLTTIEFNTYTRKKLVDTGRLQTNNNYNCNRSKMYITVTNLQLSLPSKKLSLHAKKTEECVLYWYIYFPFFVFETN